MSVYQEVTSAADARAMLAGIDGIVVMSLEGCDPCVAVWNALALERFADIPRTKISLSPDSREDRAFIRELGMTGFPTVIMYANGRPGRSSTGSVDSDDPDKVADWLARVLGLGLPAAPAKVA
jgi:hypothetical protein